MEENTQTNVILVQNILKNLTVVALTIVLTIWVIPYVEMIGDKGVDVFVLLSIFPLGAMFGYFAFSYANTNIHSTQHMILADLATFIFLTIICFSIAFATVISVKSVPELKIPFLVLSLLLMSGCLVYDFWDLYTNLNKA